MEYFDNQLCISHAELTSGYVSKSLVDKWQSKGLVQRVRRGCNSSPALYAVDSLPPKYKAEVYRRRPDLKEQADSQPFVDSITPDGAAYSYYQSYQFEDGKYLPTDKQDEYTNNVTILNAFGRLIEDANSERTKQSKKKINITDFWKRAAQALPRIGDQYPNTLPLNPRRLQEKYNEYRRRGYAALITGKFGTRNAAVIKTIEQESLLTKLLADARNLDNAQIVGLYNVVAEAMKWETITRSTVAVWRKKLDLVTSGGRLGATRFRNIKTMQIKRSRPEAPLLFWTLDGWTAELLYQKTEVKNGKRTTTYSNRLILEVVLDPCCNYPIGYAIGVDHETPELIKAALRDAANHTAELFGQRYKAYQLQSDNYGRGCMKPTYQAISEVYKPAQVHNAKAKPVEPYFKDLIKIYCQYAENFSGFGITSNQNLQPNSEFLNKKRHKFPDEAGCRLQLEQIMQSERAKKRTEYLKRFENLQDEYKIPLSDEQYLLTFGASTGYKNAICDKGLIVTIGGIKRSYECFDRRFREYAHIRWGVLYDPDNIEKALAVSEDGSLRFMLENKYVQPMAIADQQPEDKEEMSRVFAFNNGLERDIAASLGRATEVVEELFYNNPQLDPATRLMLCDSNGQNKIHKSNRRVQAHQIDSIENVEFEVVHQKKVDVQTDDLSDLY